jgi:Protein of unknown function (DUF2771)
MRRHVRALAVAGALASAAGLAGCDKPVPKITVQTGAFATTITPSTYCFDVAHCRPSTHIDLPVVSARPDDTVLVDVPREVVDHGWAVDALSLDGSKSLSGGAIPVRDRHSYRVAANANDGSPFIVQITQLRGGRPDASRWSFLVRVSDRT